MLEVRREGDQWQVWMHNKWAPAIDESDARTIARLDELDAEIWSGKLNPNVADSMQRCVEVCRRNNAECFATRDLQAHAKLIRERHPRW
ncbi:MAG: hypothetical protein K8T91_24945 [Planctomycetes bacterium]|nr:hypothetical protein [Planctomycetota bacterium]